MGIVRGGTALAGSDAGDGDRRKIDRRDGHRQRDIQAHNRNRHANQRR